VPLLPAKAIPLGSRQIRLKLEASDRYIDSFSFFQMEHYGYQKLVDGAREIAYGRTFALDPSFYGVLTAFVSESCRPSQ
jgi:hypothetical protein